MKIRLKRFALAFAVTAAMSAGGAAFAADGSPDAANEQAAVERAQQRGRLIYAHDQAAWHATDEMVRVTPKDVLPQHGGGWLVVPQGKLWRVKFYRLDTPGKPEVFFWADMYGPEVRARHLVAKDEKVDLTPQELRMVAARQTAILEAGQRKMTVCTDARPNIVVLPPASEADPVPVYILSAQAKAGEYPAGGHHELDIAPDGTVASARDFTKSCLNLSPPPEAKGNKLAGAMVTHMLDPTPTEIHVWLSLWMGQPLYVVTGPERVWPVSAGAIGPAQTIKANP